MSHTETRILAAATHIQNLSRRGFLRTGSIAAALVASGVTSLAPTRLLAEVPEGIAHLSAAEYAVFHKLMLTLLPTEGTTLVSPEALPVLQTVDGAFLAPLPEYVLDGLKAGVAYFDEAPKAAFGKPFVDLDTAEAVAFCDALAASEEVPARALFNALKFLIVTAYWAIPPTWEPIGFDGPVTDKWGIDYQGNAPLPQA